MLPDINEMLHPQTDQNLFARITPSCSDPTGRLNIPHIFWDWEGKREDSREGGVKREKEPPLSVMLHLCPAASLTYKRHNNEETPSGM